MLNAIGLILRVGATSSRLRGTDIPRVARGLATLGFVAESLWDSCSLVTAGYTPSMPELAEVEFYRREWRSGLGARIEAVRLHADKRIFRGITPGLLQKSLPAS